MMGDNNEMEMKRVISVVYSQDKSSFLGENIIGFGILSSVLQNFTRHLGMT